MFRDKSVQERKLGHWSPILQWAQDRYVMSSSGVWQCSRSSVPGKMSFLGVMGQMLYCQGWRGNGYKESETMHVGPSIRKLKGRLWSVGGSGEKGYRKALLRQETHTDLQTGGSRADWGTAGIINGVRSPGSVTWVMVHSPKQSHLHWAGEMTRAGARTCRIKGVGAAMEEVWDILGQSHFPWVKLMR